MMETLSHNTVSSTVTGLLRKLNLHSPSKEQPDKTSMTDAESPKVNKKFGKRSSGHSNHPSPCQLSPRQPRHVQNIYRKPLSRHSAPLSPKLESTRWDMHYNAPQHTRKRLVHEYEDKYECENLDECRNTDNLRNNTRSFSAIRDFFKLTKNHSNSLPNMSQPILKKGLQRHSSTKGFPRKRTSFRDQVDVQYFDCNRLVSRGSLKLKGEEKYKIGYTKKPCVRKPPVDLHDVENATCNVKEVKATKEDNCETATCDVSDKLDLNVCDEKSLAESTSTVQSAFVYTTMSYRMPGNSNHGDSSHQGDPVRDDQRPAEMKMFRLTVMLRKEYLSRQTLVKALGDGTALMVMSDLAPGAESAAIQEAQAGSTEPRYVEKIILPLAIDPFNVQACVHSATGLLVIEAPVKDQTTAPLISN